MKQTTILKIICVLLIVLLCFISALAFHRGQNFGYSNGYIQGENDTINMINDFSYINISEGYIFSIMYPTGGFNIRSNGEIYYTTWDKYTGKNERFYPADDELVEVLKYSLKQYIHTTGCS